MGSPRNHNLWWPVALAAVMLLCALAVYRGASMLASAQSQLRQVVATNQKLDRENRSLLRLAQRLRDDPTAVERAARREMDMVRPDELVYQGAVADMKPAIAAKERDS